MKSHILLILVLTFFISCKKDESNLDSIRSGKYKLISVISDEAVDINFDDIQNVDLKKELISFDNLSLYIELNSETNKDHYINILWVEPRINDQLLYSPLPLTYDPGIKIEYLPVDNAYYFNLSESSSKLLIGSRVVEEKGEHTLGDPISLEYSNNEQSIKFRGQQKFLTKTGVFTYFFTAIFQRDKDYISP